MINLSFTVFLFRDDELNIVYFDDDVSIPYVKCKEEPTFQQVISASVFNSSPNLAQKVPIRCQENAVFIVDTSKLRRPKHLLADDNGIYRNHSTSYNFVELLDGEEITSKALPRYKKVLEMQLDANQFIVAKTWYVNNSCKDFSRRITEIHSSAGLSHIRVLHYVFTGAEHEFCVQPHRNSNINVRPFIKTAESTKTRIKDSVAGSCSGPTSLHNQLFEEAGGVSNFQSEGNLQLNVCQIKYHQSLLRDKPQNDELADYVDYGFNNSEFVRNYCQYCQAEG